MMAHTSNEPGVKGISAFSVEANAPGVSTSKRDVKKGQKGAHTADVIFENC